RLAVMRGRYAKNIVRERLRQSPLRSTDYYLLSSASVRGAGAGASMQRSTKRWRLTSNEQHEWSGTPELAVDRRGRVMLRSASCYSLVKRRQAANDQ
ncbi:MAG: hypothetical protein ACP5I8_07130, partial [Phycisphaerae bacterium]